MTDLTARYYNQLPQAKGGMVPQHTPGPWKITGLNIRSEDGALLFVQGNQFFDYDPDPVEQAANRRLVAAAPAMRGALVNLIAQIETYESLHGITCPISPDVARGAILKTGPSGLEG